MHIKRKIGRVINQILKPSGYRLIHESALPDVLKGGSIGYSYNKVELPKGAREYLNQNNNRLIELKRLYASEDKAVITPSIWNEQRVKDVVLQYFRGDNPYIYQYLDSNHPSTYALTTNYIKSIDTLHLLDKLKEDNEFGIYTFEIDDKKVSRDLLDSITEMYFLEKHLGISKLPSINMLDIGAGYGRLAYRMVEAFPNIDHYFCTDAIPTSTFICEYYLRFRHVTNKAMVIPLYELRDMMENFPINIAINVCSFSECTTSAIDWWLSILSKHKVRYLMIVPDGGLVDKEGRMLVAGTREEISPILEKYKYRLIVKEPKYRDPQVQMYGVSPSYHYLFELTSDV